MTKLNKIKPFLKKNKLILSILLLEFSFVVLILDLLIARIQPKTTRTPAPTTSSTAAFKPYVSQPMTPPPKNYDWKPVSGFDETFAQFYSTPQKLLGYDLDPFTCINQDSKYSEEEFKDFIAKEGIESKILKIEDHKFDDEFEYTTSEDDLIHVQNKGLSSTKDITYDQICKNDNYYLALFYGEAEQGTSSKSCFRYGGGWNPQNSLAVFNNNEFKIFECLPQGVQKIDVDTPDNWGMPYYGCRELLGSNGQNIVFSCGGGDGPGGGSEIYELDMSTGAMKEKAFCYFHSFEVGCYDQTSNRYYYQPPTE